MGAAWFPVPWNPPSHSFPPQGAGKHNTYCVTVYKETDCLYYLYVAESEGHAADLGKQTVLRNEKVTSIKDL